MIATETLESVFRAAETVRQGVVKAQDEEREAARREANKASLYHLVRELLNSSYLNLRAVEVNEFIDRAVYDEDTQILTIDGMNFCLNITGRQKRLMYVLFCQIPSCGLPHTEWINVPSDAGRIVSGDFWWGATTYDNHTCVYK